MANINKCIRDLSAEWINPVYATQVNVPTQVEALIVHAFIHRMPEGPSTEMLRGSLSEAPAR